MSRGGLAIALSVVCAGCEGNAPGPANAPRSSTPSGQGSGASPGSAEPSNYQICDPPAEKGLTLGVERYVVPIGQSMTREGGEVTFGGRCTPGLECLEVGAAEIERLAGLVRAASPLRHQTTPASPHYGHRSITARWDTGSCTLDDGSQAPAAQTDRFYAAFEAVVETLARARRD